MYTDISAVEFNADLLHKCNQPLPRCTSYPTTPELSEDFHKGDLRVRIATGATISKRRFPSTAIVPLAQRLLLLRLPHRDYPAQKRRRSVFGGLDSQY